MFGEDYSHDIAFPNSLQNFRSGTLAIAKCRGWSVLTDDKKARRIAKELDVTLLATPEVMKLWAGITSPSTADLSKVLEAIERFANYRPGRGAVDYDWWIASIRPGEAE